MKDKDFLYIAGAFVVLVIAFSIRKVEYQEVKDMPSETLSFDSNVLPSGLKPPPRLSDNEEMPRLASPKRFSGNKSRI
jgi:hypothetical protein